MIKLIQFKINRVLDMEILQLENLVFMADGQNPVKSVLALIAKDSGCCIAAASPVVVTG